MIEIFDNWYYGCDRCIICNKHIRHYRIWIYDKKIKLPYLKENTCHLKCKNLVEKIKHKKNELLDLEFELYESII